MAMKTLSPLYRWSFKMDKITSFFENAYATTDHYWWDVPYAYSTVPEDLATSLLAQQTLRLAAERGPGRAIDMGSGEGADAIRLARLGWQVEAIELTEAGTSKIRSAAKEAGVAIRVHQADIRDFEPVGVFDLVICNGVLHYIADKSAVCSKLQSITTSGGINVISLWSSYTPVPDCHQIIPTFPDEERGTVTTAYTHWKKLLMYFERQKMERGHAEMGPHMHSYIKMIAQKP